jgi:hypothetical protein
MSGSGAVQEYKVSNCRFWRNYTPSMQGTVKTQSEQFHFSCEASSVIDQRGTVKPLQNRNALPLLVL